MPLVSLKEVTKEFVGRRRDNQAFIALRAVSADFHSGEIVTVVGPSGCGKSTMLSLIAGLDFPSRGAVRIGGQSVTEPYEHTGVVFQKDLLLPWRTALDNILLQAEVRGFDPRQFVDRAKELLALVGLQGFAHFYPHELSGGMRQRVSICRALLHDPKLLLMDEPFAALDAITRDQLALDFQHFVKADSRTVIFITHNMDEAVFLGDRVMVMTARPGYIAEVIDIDLPRPRHLAVRNSSEFIRYTGQVRELFMRHGILQDH
ncbi:MAG TPA: ABC transporter ATP-binding protein [Pseudolabrys sp.]|nr:ABC transporter ATP-binding protein [Pseudolabrys sp.]